MEREKVVQHARQLAASGAGVIELSQIYATDPAGNLCRADGFPPHAERYAWAGFELSALLAAERRVAPDGFPA